MQIHLVEARNNTNAYMQFRNIYSVIFTLCFFRLHIMESGKSLCQRWQVLLILPTEDGLIQRLYFMCVDKGGGDNNEVSYLCNFQEISWVFVMDDPFHRAVKEMLLIEGVGNRNHKLYRKKSLKYCFRRSNKK